MGVEDSQNMGTKENIFLPCKLICVCQSCFSVVDSAQLLYKTMEPFWEGSTQEQQGC